ncbi:MAG: DMT family transporter [Parvularculaceae bacterium]
MATGRPQALVRWTDLAEIVSRRIPAGPRAKAIGLAGGAVVIWATWPSLASIAQPTPPFLILSLAAAAGFVATASLALKRRDLRGWMDVPRRSIFVVALGLLGNNAFYLAAIARIGPAEANIVHYLWPVFMVGFSALALKRAPSALQWLGVFAGFGGVALALASRLSGGELSAFGVVLGICGALTFALYSVARATAKTRRDVVGPSMGVIAVASFIAHLAFEPRYLPTIPETLAIVAIGIGPFTTSNMLWDRATRAGAPAVIGSMAFMTPIVAVMLLSLLGLSSLSGWILGGAVLAVVGATLTARR